MPSFIVLVRAPLALVVAVDDVRRQLRSADSFLIGLSIQQSSLPLVNRSGQED